ncbi:30473_t:CDS:1, partial [Racocetra persica]
SSKDKTLFFSLSHQILLTVDLTNLISDIRDDKLTPQQTSDKLSATQN